MKYTWRDYLRLLIKIKPKWTVISYFEHPIVGAVPELGRPIPTEREFYFFYQAARCANDLQNAWKGGKLGFKYRVIRISEWNEANRDPETA